MKDKYFSGLTKESIGKGLEAIAMLGLKSSVFVLMNYEAMDNLLHRYWT